MSLQSEPAARRSQLRAGKQGLGQRRVLCKFFAHGSCSHGEHCKFSHDWKDQATNVCTFYQKGACNYGTRCRYEHVKISSYRGRASSSSSNSHPDIGSDSVQMTSPFGVPLRKDLQETSSRPLCNESAWKQKHEGRTLTDSMPRHHPAYVNLADRPICSFAAAGSCPHGEKCPHIHGDLCSICEKCCLHPYRLEEREAHIRTCQQNNKHLEALKLSQEIECCVCLDRVLSKSTVAERKFGLLSECDHPFCISCIRNWRSSSPSSGMDVSSTLRACPICRKLSYFVIPSVIWYSTQEEKQEIVNNYKDKLKSIDCKYFDSGNGECPFGTSCFYRHTYKPDRNRPRRHPYRPRRQTTEPEAIVEEELRELAALLSMEDELESLHGDLDHYDEDDESLLEMAFLLAQFGIGEPSSSSDDDDDGI